MKVDGNSLRPGNVIEHENNLWRIVKTQHVKPGKGGAFLQVEMKDIRHGTKLNTRFRSSESVERVRLEQREHQYLFHDNSGYNFMDQASFEQCALPSDFIGEDRVSFLQEGMQVIVEFYDELPIGISLPDHVTLEVVEAAGIIKGQTAAASNKPAVLENGMRIMVPPYIEAGVRVVVNTNDLSFVEREK
ncbi:MAG: elongation factor P [Pseudomonadota bacterium]